MKLLSFTLMTIVCALLFVFWQSLIFWMTGSLSESVFNVPCGMIFIGITYSLLDNYEGDFFIDLWGLLQTIDLSFDPSLTILANHYPR